jgi:hypothetical protein
MSGGMDPGGLHRVFNRQHEEWMDARRGDALARIALERRARLAREASDRDPGQPTHRMRILRATEAAMAGCQGLRSLLLRVAPGARRRGG